MTNATRTTIETKSAGGDLIGAFDDLHRSFSAFRETNDERLAQLETRLGADVVTEEKLDRIDRALGDAKRRLDVIALRESRPRLGADARHDGDSPAREHKAAFLSYMRTGDAAAIRTVEAKALSVGSPPDGGYLVPVPAEQEILRRMALISPIRKLASVMTISASQLKRAFSYGAPASGWVGETGATPQTATPQLADLSFPAMEHYAMPAATQQLIDDSVFDIEQWLASEIEIVFAEQEGTAFVVGTGVQQPTGLMTYPKVAQASWAWGGLGYVATGVAGAFAAASPSDSLFDLSYATKPGYRANSSFLMNRRTLSAIRKFKTTTGQYLWAPPISVDKSATLMDFPVFEAEDMPDIGAGAFPVAFGDFRRGYVVVDRTGIRVLRDPFTAKPYVLFYTTKRVGGGVQDFDAIKLLKTDVS